MTWTPLWNSTDEELIAAARTIENPSALLTELAERLANAPDYQDEVDALTKENDQLEEKVGALNAEIEDLTSKNSELEDTIYDLKQELNKKLENANVA